MLSKIRKMVAAVTLLALVVTAVPASADEPASSGLPELPEIQVMKEDKVDLNGDGQVTVQEARLMASYRLATAARDEYVATMKAEEQEVTQEILDLLTPKDPRTIAPESYDTETIRNVLINLWTRWEYTWFQAEFLMKFALLGGGIAATNALRAQWNRAGQLIQNLIGWAILTPDIIRQQFTNMIRNAGYSETIANRVGVVMKQFIEWLCNHPEWFD